MKLSTAIRQIQEELIQSQQLRESSNLDTLFKLSTIEIELNVTFKEETKNDGKFNLQVISVGGAETYSKETVQTVRIKLEPNLTGSNQLLPGMFPNSDNK